MGAYNVVSATVSCPSCSREARFAVQFKYGDTFQHEYAIGDELRWGGNDVGRKGRGHVVVDGVAETPCPFCGNEAELEFYVHVVEDRLVLVELADGKHDFVKAGATFVILRE